MKIAIDLLWVRPQKVGGTESYIRNLMDGFTDLENNYEFWLLVSKDNCSTFEHYKKDRRFHIHVCDVKSNNVNKRIIWQNLHLGKEIKKLGLKFCFEPYYCKPILGTHGIDFITTIHDLQALHYPEYFSKSKVLWMKFSWWNAIRTSKYIVTISEFVKNDVTKYYKNNLSKIRTIYNPILVDQDEVKPFSEIKEKYSIEDNEYYFTVSSLLPHKNIETIIKVFNIIKEKNLELPCNLVISGVGGKSREKLERLISEYELRENVKLTDFIDNAERNTLYKHCRAFLFPSVFEGFGMPPIEAMFFHKPVICTKKTCLEEVTQGKANYVEDPFCVDEWIEKMEVCVTRDINFERYNVLNISQEYLDLFNCL